MGLAWIKPVRTKTLTDLPLAPMAHLPTPLEPLPRLSDALGIELWTKRDDQTGLALGGNKTRKLAYLVGDALTQGCDTLITTGAPQSNHCRQTAAAAARAGLRAVLVLGGTGITENTGNILLDHLLGAEIVWAGERNRNAALQATAEAQATAGYKPYVIPLGGSNPIGAAAYYYAAGELAGQLAGSALPPFDRIVFASSSGGTHAGLALGVAAHGWPTQVLGVSVDEDKLTLTGGVAHIANATAELLGLPQRFTPADIHATTDYLGEGYALMGPPEREAIHLFARLEGLIVDPVYTGRAAAGLLDLCRTGQIAPGERVLFWHTGGTPAVFAYAAQLVD